MSLLVFNNGWKFECFKWCIVVYSNSYLFFHIFNTEIVSTNTESVNAKGAEEYLEKENGGTDGLI